jgi:hypothetical protein
LILTGFKYLRIHEQLSTKAKDHSAPKRISNLTLALLELEKRGPNRFDSTFKNVIRSLQKCLGFPMRKFVIDKVKTPFFFPNLHMLDIRTSIPIFNKNNKTIMN